MTIRTYRNIDNQPLIGITYDPDFWRGLVTAIAYLFGCIFAIFFFYAMLVASCL